MKLPSIEFSDECDNTSLFNLLHMLKQGRAVEKIEEYGPVFEFVLKDGRVLVGAYLGDDDTDSITIALWRDSIVYTEEQLTLQVEDIDKLIYI